MRIQAWGAGVLLLALAGPALGAQSEEQDFTNLPAFKKADNNGDGSLTYKEVNDEKAKVPKKQFKEEDLDDDGKLSKYDYKYGLK
ncbi:MAG: hypothetical protein ABEK42_02180 [Thiohalorhabdaceae bacterium]